MPEKMDQNKIIKIALTCAGVIAMLVFAFYAGALLSCQNGGGGLLSKSFACVNISNMGWCKEKQGGFSRTVPSNLNITIDWPTNNPPLYEVEEIKSD